MPQRALTQALDRVRNSIVNTKEADGILPGRAYGLYVLARGGRGLAGELRYDADTRLDAFKTPMEKAHLGAALMLIGDGQRAEAVFSKAVAATAAPEAPNTIRYDYGSLLRDRAGIVTLASETRVKSANVPQLVDVLAKARAETRFTSTQEQAWMVMAARAMGDQARAQTLTINGRDHAGVFQQGLRGETLAEQPLTIANKGDQAVSAVVSVVGAALTPEPAISKGFAIEREVFTLEGKAVDLASLKGGKATVKQNDRFVLVVTVKAEKVGGRILLVDKLPAGFEIENPRLVDAGNTKSLSWLEGLTKAEHSEFRDDRMVAAFNFSGRPGAARSEDADDDDDKQSNGPRKEAKIAYIVRAVTPGTFIHPAATVEDMYRPDRHARTATGTLEVTAK